jgi:NADH-quinone oxidoreductase subunit E
LGVYHFDQIAAWSSENVSWIERYLAFKGRIGREQWVEQARRLAEQDGRDAARRFREDETV